MAAERTKTMFISAINDVVYGKPTVWTEKPPSVGPMKALKSRIYLSCTGMKMAKYPKAKADWKTPDTQP